MIIIIIITGILEFNFIINLKLSEKNKDVTNKIGWFLE